jgi:hypothetical protein
MNQRSTVIQGNKAAETYPPMHSRSASQVISNSMPRNEEEKDLPLEMGKKDQLEGSLLKNDAGRQLQ